jgi:diketogulonate reductase-like aldo/keto reductase
MIHNAPFIKHLPLIGLGTWDLRGQECISAVREALEIGYRHIDTASIYENHAAVSEGIGKFPREKLFITTKITLEDIDWRHIPDSVEKACDKALEELKTDYIDLYLLHWPDHHKPMHELVAAIHKLKEKGKIKNGGVSNCTVHHLSDLLAHHVPVAANQVEFHPYLYQRDLHAFCIKHAIQLIAYRSLGKGELVKEPLCREIGQRHNKTPSQIILRWVTQKGIPIIPKARSRAHLLENLALDFTLTPDEVEQIDSLDRGTRFCMTDHPEFKY